MRYDLHCAGWRTREKLYSGITKHLDAHAKRRAHPPHPREPAAVMIRNPRWVLALHGVAGAALALVWLLTLRLQLQFVVTTAVWLQR